MRFPQAFIEKVRDASNLVDIISQYTQLKPSGGGLMGRCPFPDHQEKTASFSVSEAKQVYHCFGCQKSGNIFTFLQVYNGMNFPEAIEYLANRASIPLPERDSATQEKDDKANETKKQMLRANKLSAAFFFDQLQRAPSDSPVSKYLERRGLDREIIESFQVGYAPNDWEQLSNHLQQNQIPMSLAEEARLVRARTQGKSGYYDLFRDRLMFPIIAPSGEVLAFGGRIIEQGEPKYLNSPETPVFIKGRVLYGLHQTARYIRSEDWCIIVEGYMDLVSLYQAGIRNVAATMGTAMTAEHAKLIKRMTKNVVVLFDGDSAGQEAAERSLPILLMADLYPKGLILPGGMDPDDFVRKHGLDALAEKLAQAPDLLMLVLDQWMTGFKGEPADKIKLVDKLKPILSDIPDARLKDLYISEVARKLTVAVPWLKGALGETQIERSSKSFGQNARNQSSQNSPKQSLAESNFKEVRAESNSVPTSESSESKILISRASKPELILLSLVLKSRANFEQFLKEEMVQIIVSEPIRKILERASVVYRQDPDKFDKLASLLISHVDRPELLFLSEAQLGGITGGVYNGSSSGSSGVGVNFDAEAEAKYLKDCVRRVRELGLREMLKQITLDLKTGHSSEKLEKLKDIQREIQALTKSSS